MASSLLLKRHYDHIAKQATLRIDTDLKCKQNVPITHLSYDRSVVLMQIANT